MIIPKIAYLCSGAGHGKYNINAFDRALLDAGIHNMNIVQVSSILPPGCIVSKSTPPHIVKGSIAFCVMSVEYGKGVVISSVIACAIPQNPNDLGMFFENHGQIPEKENIEECLEMLETGMADRNIQIKAIEYVSTYANAFENQAYCTVASAYLME